MRKKIGSSLSAGVAYIVATVSYRLVNVPFLCLNLLLPLLQLPYS